MDNTSLSIEEQIVNELRRSVGLPPIQPRTEIDELTDAYNEILRKFSASVNDDVNYLYEYVTTSYKYTESMINTLTISFSILIVCVIVWAIIQEFYIRKLEKRIRQLEETIFW